MLILLAGAAIQFHALTQDVRFFPDEALFSTFARNAALGGDWLLHGSLDKPPLSIYASAISMNLVAARVENGVLNFDPRMGEFAARLPNALASIALIAVSYALAQTLYRRRTVSAWAAVLVGFSPYLAVYGATAYTDGLMITFGALALLLAARDHWLGSGIALALAFASKQQALYWLPLILIIGWAMDRLTVRRVLTLVVPLIVPARRCWSVGTGCGGSPPACGRWRPPNNPIGLIAFERRRAPIDRLAELRADAGGHAHDSAGDCGAAHGRRQSQRQDLRSRRAD